MIPATCELSIFDVHPSCAGLGCLLRRMARSGRISPKCMSEWRDRLLLFCGLLFLLGVTEDDQGVKALSLEEWL